MHTLSKKIRIATYFDVHYRNESMVVPCSQLAKTRKLGTEK